MDFSEAVGTRVGLVTTLNAVIPLDFADVTKAVSGLLLEADALEPDFLLPLLIGLVVEDDGLLGKWVKGSLGIGGGVGAPPDPGLGFTTTP